MKKKILIIFCTLVISALLVAISTPVVAEDPIPNPELTSSCGIDMVLILDSSGSISTSEFSDMVIAFNYFVDAFLPKTPTRMAVVHFSSSPILKQTYTNNITDIKDAIANRTMSGGTLYIPGLQEALDEYNASSRADKPDLFIFASDGVPGDIGQPDTIIAKANTIKQEGIKIITLGIGSSLSPSILENMSSPDDFYQTDFETLANELANLSKELCGGTISVQKFVNGTPTPGWNFTATVTNGTSDPVYGLTDESGFIVFDINITEGESMAYATITEIVQSEYSFMNATAFNCSDVEVGTPGINKISDIPVTQLCGIYCRFNNSNISVDNTPPIQTLNFGYPKTYREWFGVNYTVPSCTTPIWINSTDPGGVGSSHITYSVWNTDDPYPNANGSIVTEFIYENTVYDGDPGDMDATNGSISVEVFMNESCFHEIIYQCWDYNNNTDGHRDIDFIVDCCGPNTSKLVGQPRYGNDYPFWVSCLTPLWFNSVDECCRPNGTAVDYLEIMVWWKSHISDLNESWQLNKTIVVYDGDPNDTNPEYGRIGYELHLDDDCGHEIWWRAFDIFG
ncbi:MAG: VWA domain-containing protein, partial [Thermoplasmatales archaeon]